jgi:cytochrome P450
MPPIEVDTSELTIQEAYERFDVGINQGIRDGAAIMNQLRAAGRVLRASGSTPFGDWTLPGIFQVPPEMDLTMVFSYDAVTTCLREAEIFKHKMYPDVGGETFLHMDGAEHRRYRLLLGEVFSPGACKRWNDSVIVPVVDELVGALERSPDRRADLRTALCEPLPSHVFGAICDAPREDFDKLKAWAVYVIAAAVDPESAQRVQSLGMYLGMAVGHRRSLPPEELAERRDLISAMVRAKRDEAEPLTDAEIVSALFILVAAGNETTSRGLASTLYHLLTVPGAYEAVVADRSLVQPAIDETLRLAPAGGCFELRLATQDTELDGHPIAAGSGVVANLWAANRDPSRWEHADIFDLHRPKSANVAFGFGPHMCLGIHLARIEMQTTLNAVLDRLPHLRLDPDEPSPTIEGMWFPGVQTLPVVWG